MHAEYNYFVSLLLLLSYWIILHRIHRGYTSFPISFRGLYESVASPQRFLSPLCFVTNFSLLSFKRLDVEDWQSEGSCSVTKYCDSAVSFWKGEKVLPESQPLCPVCEKWKPWTSFTYSTVSEKLLKWQKNTKKSNKVVLILVLKSHLRW